MTTELNELSKSTLRSYVDKAKDSEREHQAASARASTEYLDKKDHDPVGAADAVARSVKHQFKSVKRMVGAYKAKRKLGEEMDLQEETCGPSLLEALLNKDFVAIREAINELMAGCAVERIDELSKETLKSYAKKARTSSDRLFKKAEKEEDKAMSTNGGKYPEKVERHQKAASAAIAKGVKRDVGIYLANRKIKSKGD